jgi:hypothetical protein
MSDRHSGGPGDIPQEQTLEASEEPPQPTFGTYPFSYTRYRLFPDTVAQYKTFPYKMTGKLFFTIPGEGDAVCSGASVNSTNRSVVWTAGHCVAKPGVGFHTNFLFAPARRLGTSPFGTWTVKQIWTFNEWVNSGAWEFDLAALVMNLQAGSNAKIGNKVGFLGFLANAARQQHWHLHVYPLAPRNLGSTPPGAQFDGLHHEICASAWAIDDDPTEVNGPLTIGVGCDKTGGTSGGPWVVNFSGVNAATTNLLNGNNSYRYLGPSPDNLELYSPYFGQAAIDLRNFAQATPVP